MMLTFRVTTRSGLQFTFEVPEDQRDIVMRNFLEGITSGRVLELPDGIIAGGAIDAVMVDRPATSPIA